jgi:hypothetical protein
MSLWQEQVSNQSHRMQLELNLIFICFKLAYLLNSRRNNNFSRSFQPFVLIRKKLVILVHFKGFNISQKPKSSSLSYCRSLADNLHIWREIIWHCCQNDRLFQNKWPKRLTHATYASYTWSSILQFSNIYIFVH